ncbi:MAG TPA: LysM peptidoglycan-binding domain-containing protein [Dermatophilaceae bacterium]|nr:LysM peptidoglycan-binding domain-containing protein [Dermatophilaceae bacterium]
MPVPAPVPALPPAATIAPPMTVLTSATRWAPYVVRTGDTLWDIAQRTHTTVGTLVAHNRLPNGGAHLVPGQVLQVPSSASTARPSGTAAPRPVPSRTYVVRRGDTLTAIAARFRVPVGSLARANRVSNPHVIRVGQRLAVPGAKPSTPVAKPAAVPDTFLGRTYPAAVAHSAAHNRAVLAKAPVPTRAQTRTLLIAAARAQGVDPRLVLAIAWQESGWNQRLVSPANAIGIMQVIPSSGQWASSMVGRKLNLLDPRDNVTAGVAIIRSLLRSADNTQQAIAGYYQGLAGVRQNGMYADTRQYVANVLAIRARMR